MIDRPPRGRKIRTLSNEFVPFLFFFFYLFHFFLFYSHRTRDSVDGVDGHTKQVLEKLGIVPDNDDVKIVQYVCAVASNRAALLVSICT